MKIVSVSAKEVYGHLNVSVKFNNDLTILVGPNGSGKTTILYLMHLALSLTLDKLALIVFRELRLEMIDETNKKQIITFTNMNDTLTISIPGYSSSNFQFKYFPDDPYSYTHIQREIQRIPKYNKIIKYFEDFKNPCFLNVERIEGFKDIESEYGYHDARAGRREIQYSQKQRLRNVAELIEQRFKAIADEREKISKELYIDIFMSLFRESPPRTIQEDNFLVSIEQILAMPKSVLDLTRKILPKNREELYSQEIRDFFSKVPSLSTKDLDVKNQTEVMNYLGYSFQLKRIIALKETYNQYNDKIDRINKPIDLFIEVLNDFFGESNTLIEIDLVGKIVVTRPNGTRSDLYQLSSGETQLLIIFAYLVFGANYDNRVFIIDEPELSLHLSWQEKLVDEIMSLKPKFQIIMATHSPDVIGKYTKKGKNISTYEKV